MFGDPPVVDPLNRHRIQLVPAHSSLTLDEDELRLDEDVEVLHHPSAAQVWKAFDELPRREGPLRKSIEDAPARWVRERLPD